MGHSSAGLKRSQFASRLFGLRRTSPAFVAQEKKKVHKKTLSVERYFVGRIRPLSAELLAESIAKLETMDANDRKRIQLEESRNKFESYMYKVKNQLVDNAESIEAVTNEKQRKEMSKLAAAAEEWLEDEGYKADLATTEDKYAELSTPFEKILLRIEESTARPEAVEKMRKKLSDVEATVANWVDEKPQITEKEREEVLKKVEEARKWLDDKEKKQDKKKPHEDPVFLSAEIPEQLVAIRQKVKLLNKRPKPKPKVEKKEADANATAATNTTSAGESENATATPLDTNTTTDEPAPESSDNSSEESANDATGEESTDKAEEGVEDEL